MVPFFGLFCEIGRFSRALKMSAPTRYDEMQSESRWRFPHQRARWFGMTVLFGPLPLFAEPQNDTERVRVKTITDHVRHDLAARPAGKFQFVCLLRQPDEHKIKTLPVFRQSVYQPNQTAL